MEEKTKDIIRKLVVVIRAAALAGQAETLLYGNRSDKYMYDEDIDVHWKSVGKFLLVYIETFGFGNRYCYRLYKCSKYAIYDRKVVLDSALENDDCRCVFSFEEDSDHEGRACCLESGNWFMEFEKTMNELVCE